jgi:hypothetical protein
LAGLDSRGYAARALSSPDPVRPTAWTRWLVLLVPLVGVVELALHAQQVAGPPGDADWNGAREWVQGKLGPDDLVVFSPTWVDPIGRMRFGSPIITLDRVARPDESRFARAFDVSVRGDRAAEVASWPVVEEHRSGAITVRLLRNPAPVVPADDLLAHAHPGDLEVDRFDRGAEQPCAWTQGAIRSTEFLFGPALPAEAARCADALVGITVMPVLDYAPRRCLVAEPPGHGATLRLRFPRVTFRDVLYGYHGLFVDMEREGKGAPIALVFRSGDRLLGALTHIDGDGWKHFELPTGELSGTTAELVAEVSAPDPTNRLYCFAADTR